MSESRNSLSPDHFRAVKLLAGSAVEDDAAEAEPEVVAGWLGDDPEFIAELNRAKSYRSERLRADVRSLASDAVATLRDLVSRPGLAASVRLRASLAILQAVGVLKADDAGSKTAEGVEAELDHKRFIESLG